MLLFFCLHSCWYGWCLFSWCAAHRSIGVSSVWLAYNVSLMTFIKFLFHREIQSSNHTQSNLNMCTSSSKKKSTSVRFVFLSILATSTVTVAVLLVLLVCVLLSLHFRCCSFFLYFLIVYCIYCHCELYALPFEPFMLT